MKKNVLLRLNGGLVIFFIVIACIFIGTSCGTNNVMSKRDNCITMTRGQVQAWLQTGWHNPADQHCVPFLFFTPITGAAIKVDAYPTDKDTIVQYGKRVNMKIAGITPPCSFPGSVQIVPNYYDFLAAGFADGTGNLIAFRFLRLRPRVYSGNATYMSFDVEIVTGTGSQELVTAMGETKPCPPYCPVQ